jgi:hypothetical protein
MKLPLPPKKAVRIATAVLIAAFFWAFQGRALKSHFGPDELMNIYGYWHPPLATVVLANLAFWSKFVRPMAGVYYLPLFHFFKLNPVPYTWVRIAILGLNTVLFYKLARRISRSWWVAALAALPVAYQANLGNLSFDGAYIYDTLCGGFYFAALLYYIDRRTGRAYLNLKQTCVFLVLTICALNSKEMGVSLAVVAISYELLLEKQKEPGFANLMRRLGATLVAGGITAIFILGKALGAGSLTNIDAYRPVLTWVRFSESTVRFFNTIFYADGLTMEHDLTLWGVLLCAGIVGLLRRRPDPRWMFLWIWVMVTPLPIVFLPGRGAGLLYIVSAGWAMAAAMLLRSASWLLSRELFLSRPARLWTMGLLWLLCAVVYADETQVVHRYVVYGYLLTGKETAEAISRFRKLDLHPKPASRIVFLRDPFPDTFDMTFLAALGWGDPSLIIFQQSQVHLPPDQVAAMDYIVDYTGQDFVVVKQ